MKSASRLPKCVKNVFPRSQCVVHLSAVCRQKCEFPGPQHHNTRRAQSVADMTTTADEQLRHVAVMKQSLRQQLLAFHKTMVALEEAGELDTSEALALQEGRKIVYKQWYSCLQLETLLQNASDATDDHHQCKRGRLVAADAEHIPAESSGDGDQVVEHEASSSRRPRDASTFVLALPGTRVRDDEQQQCDRLVQQMQNYKGIVADKQKDGSAKKACAEFEKWQFSSLKELVYTQELYEQYKAVFAHAVTKVLTETSAFDDADCSVFVAYAINLYRAYHSVKGLEVFAHKVCAAVRLVCVVAPLYLQTVKSDKKRAFMTPAVLKEQLPKTCTDTLSLDRANNRLHLDALDQALNVGCAMVQAPWFALAVVSGLLHKIQPYKILLVNMSKVSAKSQRFLARAAVCFGKINYDTHATIVRRWLPDAEEQPRLTMDILRVDKIVQPPPSVRAGAVPCRCAENPLLRVPFMTQHGPIRAEQDAAVEVLIVTQCLSSEEREAGIDQVDTDGRGAFVKGTVVAVIDRGGGKRAYDVMLPEFYKKPRVRVHHVYDVRERPRGADRRCTAFPVGTIVEWRSYLEEVEGYRWYPGIVVERQPCTDGTHQYVVDGYEPQFKKTTLPPHDVRSLSNWVPAITDDRFVPRHDLASACCDEQ